MKKQCRKHLYPLIKKWFERGWRAKDIVEELAERGEEIKVHEVWRIHGLVSEVEHSDCKKGTQWEKHALDVFFEKLRYRWKREGRL